MRPRSSRLPRDAPDPTRQLLVGVLLVGVLLVGVLLLGVSLLGVSLLGVLLPGVLLPGVSVVGAKLGGVKLWGVRLLGVRLGGVWLSGVSLSGVWLPDDAPLHAASRAHTSKITVRVMRRTLPAQIVASMPRARRPWQTPSTLGGSQNRSCIETAF